MSALSPAELEYLTSGERRLGRLATVGSDGTPQVVPVGYRVDPDSGAIEIRGRDLTATKKFRDVARSGRAAIVVDDLASVEPWRPRAVAIRGRAEALDRGRPRIRLHPDRVRSWGLGEDPEASDGND
jgi:pyridoxamine 5'-phosphate oxidase family protein